MKRTAHYGRRLTSGLLALAAGSQGEGLKLLIQNIEAIGPRQWIGLVAGSLAVGTPVTGRLAGVLARRAKPPGADTSVA